MFQKILKITSIKIIKLFLGLFAIAFMTGCSDWTEKWTTASRINRAFPQSTEIRIKYEELQIALQATPTTQRVNDHYKRLMQLRALNCTESENISWYESVDSIRTKVKKQACFLDKDKKILEWLSTQYLAIELGKSAWREFAELPISGSFAAPANTTRMLTSLGSQVALLRSNAGAVSVVDMKDGAVLSKFQSPTDWYQGGSLSPNGRLLAMPISNSSLRIYRLDTTEVVFDTGSYTSLVEWLPKQEAVLLKDRQGDVSLLDFRTGTLTKTLEGSKYIEWSIPVTGSTTQYVIGSSAFALLVDFERSVENGLSATVKKRWSFRSQKSSGMPRLFKRGQMLVYTSHPDLAWVNLADDSQDKWSMMTMGVNQFAQVSDQELAFIEIDRFSSSSKWKQLNLANMELAEITDVDAKSGYSVSLEPRYGVAKFIDGSIAYMTKLKTADAEPFEIALARSKASHENYLVMQNARTLEVQREGTEYAIGSAAAAQAAAAAAAAASTNARVDSSRSAYIDALSAQVRAANTQAAIRDGLSRETIENIRKGRPLSGNNQASAGTDKLLKNVPSDAVLHAVGVYEGFSETGRKFREHPALPVTINVKSGSRPLVLALSSYEPVRWIINNPSNRRISGVLLSSYSESTVSGSTAPLTQIGSSYAYKPDSNEYRNWMRDLSRYVATPANSFQGKYTGKQFDIN